MPRAFCPHFQITCLSCGDTAVTLLYVAATACYRIECQSCHVSDAVVYGLAPEEFARLASPAHPCLRHPGGWCPVAVSGCCARYCPSTEQAPA